ncbi:MAG: HEAT repeat domain-containing protein [Thermoguttaceae bacterium]
MNKKRLLAIVVVAVIGAGAAFYAINVIRAQTTAAYWRHQLAAAPDDEVENVAHGIAELDAAGIPVLIEALGSERECVAQAAKQELFARLEQWRTLSADEYALRLTALAEELAGQVDHFCPEGQRDAADVAGRMLIRPLQGGGVEAHKLLAASEKILRVGLNAKGESKRIKTAAFARPALLAADDISNALELPWSESSESAEETINDGGSAGKSVFPPEGSDDDESPAADSLANQPWMLGRQGKNQKRASRIADSDETPSQSGRNVALDGQSAGTGRVRPVSHDAAGIDGRLSALLAAEDAVELTRELNAKDDTKAEAAEAELIRRGFTKMQLDLARKLFDPNPQVRKRLVQELPGLQGVDAVPWLMELCRDAETEVRLTAITFLATSSDPAVLDEIERIAGRDSDSGVRGIAERIARQRNARR